MHTSVNTVENHPIKASCSQFLNTSTRVFSYPFETHLRTIFDSTEFLLHNSRRQLSSSRAALRTQKRVFQCSSALCFRFILLFEMKIFGMRKSEINSNCSGDAFRGFKSVFDPNGSL
ncbi:hypothetical protein CEXT_217631 [Caerostris extrusa]|uniref:Uncharacterized protein n=1 Tax=Caerostris extrusa TaxID=172846 RepID=A0AAV4S5S5_CAEEX|nr:hypothetical protein CEXT_217631 [Caerostris extrusa]